MYGEEYEARPTTLYTPMWSMMPHFLRECLARPRSLTLWASYNSSQASSTHHILVWALLGEIFDKLDTPPSSIMKLLEYNTLNNPIGLVTLSLSLNPMSPSLFRKGYPSPPPAAIQFPMCLDFLPLMFLQQCTTFVPWFLFFQMRLITDLHHIWIQW